ncbi:hypothetical protein HN873_059757 [Arachis hypogaea]
MPSPEPAGRAKMAPAAHGLTFPASGVCGLVRASILVQWTSHNVAGSEPPTSPRSEHFTGPFNRLPGPVGQGYRLVEYISVARVRPRTSKGITDLLLPQTSVAWAAIVPLRSWPWRVTST